MVMMAPSKIALQLRNNYCPFQVDYFYAIGKFFDFLASTSTLELAQE